MGRVGLWSVCVWGGLICVVVAMGWGEVGGGVAQVIDFDEKKGPGSPAKATGTLGLTSYKGTPGIQARARTRTWQVLLVACCSWQHSTSYKGSPGTQARARHPRRRGTRTLADLASAA